MMEDSSGTSAAYFTPSEGNDNSKAINESTIQVVDKHERRNVAVNSNEGGLARIECRERTSIGDNDTGSTEMDYQQNDSSSLLDTNSTAIDIYCGSNTTYDISESCFPVRKVSEGTSSTITEIIADLSKVKDEILSMSAEKAEIVLTKDIGTSTEISDLPTDEDSDDEKLVDGDIEKLVDSDIEKQLDSDMVQLIGTDEDKTIDTFDEKLHFMNISENDNLDKHYEVNITADDLDSINSKITESNFKMEHNDSSRSAPFTLHTSDDSTCHFNENTYSDGYFNASLDKLYKEKKEEEQEDVGCFDAREADQGKPFLFSR